MSEILNQLYLIKVDSQGQKSEVPVTQANFLIGNSGSVNFGLDSCIRPLSDFQEAGAPIASIIGGGQYNNSSGAWGVIDGGLYNSNRSRLGGVIGGGIFNQTLADYAVIAGGYWNCIGYARNINGNPVRPNDFYSYSFIGGGSFNRIEGNTGDQNSLVNNSIVGGQRNLILSSPQSFIGGGICNTISGGGFITNHTFNTIVEGCCNNIRGGLYSSILNGEKNTILSSYSSILAGRCSLISSNHSGAVIISDAQSRVHASSGPNTLTLDFISGTFIKNKIILENSYVPSSSASFGVSGQITTDSNYIYSHDGVRWRRTALAEW